MAVSSTTWKKGVSPNPSGRPTKVPGFKQKLAQYADKAVKGCTDKSYDDAVCEFILKTMTESNTFAERKWAIEMYLNRRYGKVPEAKPEDVEEDKQVRIPKIGLKVAK